MSARREVVVLPSGDLVLSPAVCAELVAMAVHPIRAALSPAAAYAAEVIERVGRAYRSSDAGTITPAAGSPGPRSLRDPIDARTAAGLLACSDRYVRRLASEGRLPARDDVGGGWTFERADVLAYRDRDGG